MSNISRTDWTRVDALTEEEIETSDSPPLGEEFVETSHWWKPRAASNVLLALDPETLAWFQSQGDDYEQKMAAALRSYATSHQSKD
jgi:uncharacterized protein (DUF4415 family)